MRGAAEGNGLRGMRERLAAWAAPWIWWPLHPGTRVQAAIPLQAAPAGSPRGSNPPGEPAMIRILIADDQALLRAGFRALLDAEPDMEVVGESGTGRETVRLARELHPDVVLMDIRMPDGDGLEAARRDPGRPCPGRDPHHHPDHL